MSTDDPTVENWDEFLEHIHPSIPRRGNPHGLMGFRGQERHRTDWKLHPSLARQLPKRCDLAAAIDIERRLVGEFKLDGHRHLATWEVPGRYEEYQAVGWLMVMQRYGAPTRLLDWTLSPYVAAYFAVRDAPDDDGAVWIQNYPKLVEALRASKTEVSLGRIEKGLAGVVPDPSDPPGICSVYQSLQRSDRMYAQQGFYMVCEDPRRAHDEVMEEIGKAAGVEPFVHKVVIKHTAKEQFLANLRMMNITGASLFPGPDGLGRHVAEWGRLLAGGLAEVPVEDSVEGPSGQGAS